MYNYEIDCAMRKEAERMENAIKTYYETRKFIEVYCIFISADCGTGKYFIDIEIGGEPHLYKHWRGYYTGEQIRKAWNIN